MKQFKITVGDKSQITTTGVELYTSILKKFGVEYTIEEINQPKKFDTTQWFNNLAYSQFTHKEIEAGLPEEVFKESGIPIERYIQYA